MDHAEIIKKLGGADAVARTLGQSKAAVASWRDRNNIPARVWVELINIHGAKDADVTLYSLAEGVKQRRNLANG